MNCYILTISQAFHSLLETHNYPMRPRRKEETAKLQQAVERREIELAELTVSILKFLSEYSKAYIPLRRKTLSLIISHGDTNMLVSKNAKICVTPNANAKICITPKANPQREQVEYRLCWVPNAKFSHWPCTFNFFGVNFIRVGSRFSVE